MKARGKTCTAPQAKAVLSALPSPPADPASHLAAPNFFSKQQSALLKSVTTFHVYSSTTNSTPLSLRPTSIPPSPLRFTLIASAHLLRPTCLYSTRYRMRR